MEPLTKLSPDKRAIYNELSEAQQQRYWKLWQAKGPAPAQQMALLWVEGNQAARYEDGHLNKSRKQPSRRTSVKSYLLQFFESQQGPFYVKDVREALKEAGSTHSESTIKTALSEARVAGLIRLKHWETHRYGRTGVYEVVGGAV